ncbi:1-acyl-sn-glycerol-3-phosphate acyltransferase [Streptomyces sp. NPDC057717]|uniref:1-acyl-sn-glycerol-3-phosphate acyltransferase n=1 Tax=Streptomyces sp. NPDC057717 TaxID=3346224 RepID=UPI0036A645AC
MSNMPVTHGLISIVNHNFSRGPLSFGHFQCNVRRRPKFLAKGSLFKRLARNLFRTTEQISVSRDKADASAALRNVNETVGRGESVALSLRVGAARVALATMCPVADIPLPSYGKMRKEFPRTKHTALSDPPVDLCDSATGRLLQKFSGGHRSDHESDGLTIGRGAWGSPSGSSYRPKKAAEGSFAAPGES